MAGLKCEGCQLGLESLQRCLAYCYLRESIPQHDRSGEETLMVAGERCWNLGYLKKKMVRKVEKMSILKSNLNMNSSMAF